MENHHEKQPRANEHLDAKETVALGKEVAALARQNHGQNRRLLLQALQQRSREGLIEGLLTELDAKNKAYYFILERGYLAEFSQYCQSSPKVG